MIEEYFPDFKIEEENIENILEFAQKASKKRQETPVYEYLAQSIPEKLVAIVSYNLDLDYEYLIRQQSSDCQNWLELGDATFLAGMYLDCSKK